MIAITGTIINVLGILIGSVVGLTRKTPMEVSTQGLFRIGLGLGTILCGLWLTWVHVNGTFLQIVSQVVVIIVAMILGRLLGKMMRLQKLSNRLGRFTRERMEGVKPGQTMSLGDGFNACAAVFCAAPLGIIGSVTDGLATHWQPLAIKAVMDALAAMGFVAVFRGNSVLLSALPVLAFQGSIALLCHFALGPWLVGLNLVDPVVATAGLLMCAVAQVMLNVKRVELADYLPSLVVAPLLAWLVGRLL